MFQLTIDFLIFGKKRKNSIIYLTGAEIIIHVQISQKVMCSKRPSKCRKTIAGVKWHDIKLKGRASWFLARRRKTSLGRDSSKVVVDSRRENLFAKRIKSLDPDKLPDSESSSLVSEATTQLDDFGDDDFEAYRHDSFNDVFEDSEGFDITTETSPSSQAGGSSKCETKCTEIIPKRTRCAGSLVSLDCEMVGGGPHKRKNLLARCAVLDEAGQLLRPSTHARTHPLLPPRLQAT